MKYHPEYLKSRFAPVCAAALCLSSFSAWANEGTIDFNRDIRPILSGKCFACHGPDEEERKGGLRLDTEEGSRKDAEGVVSIVPGDPEASELIFRVTTDDASDRMPPEGKGKALSPKEVALLEKWIEEGGKYAQHWAYQKPVPPQVPKMVNPDWAVHNPIDSFVQKRLTAEGLKPSPTADRFTLARRLALDLTGLPTRFEEARTFADDSRPDAVERYVDSLLASPAFGERWAEFWLDLARYADSAGYADDPPRTIWAYRDWVIRALNRNLPFDQFSIQQIAGDLLPNPDDDQLIATSFHRNTLTNNEGGTQDEEFRNVAVVDRVNTTMEVWMATTMACAQCHTHKFDPITHDEYFQMFDFFNQSQDADRRDESPLLEIWGKELLTAKEQWKEEIAELKKKLATPTPELDASRQTWLAGLKAEPSWEPLSLAGGTGGDLQSGDAGWITAQGERPAKASYQLEFPTLPGEITALRLETSPDQKANFVLSQISASWQPTSTRALDGRFVRVEIPGKSRFLHLAEIEIFSQGENVARSGKASQSSTDFGGAVERINDGNTNGDYEKNSVTHTRQEDNPWIEIDLGRIVPIDSITLWNRTGGESRLAGYKIQVLNPERGVVWEQRPQDIPNPSHFAMSGAIPLFFKSASANFEQNGFPASAVLNEKIDPKTGWSIAGRTADYNDLTLILPEAVKTSAGTLTVTLAQQSQFPQHVLTHFRIAVTGEKDITEWSRMPGNIRALVRKKDRNPAEEETLATYHRGIAPPLQPLRDQLAALEKKLAEVKPDTTVPIMRDLPDGKERVTKLHLRGNYLTTGHEVKKGVPAVFHPIPADQPNNRLGLAHWLMDRENPLTARVIVNRFWEQIFGMGIVPTSEEFGSQGELPSHPELLDWLALEFQKDWDLKRLLKLMVTSATYQQSSETTPALIEADPFNLLYARGPRFRVSAAMVRDQALFVSGLLSDKMYGPPVKPPQPNLGLRAAFGGATDWETSKGEDRFRRGIYTLWRRSSPYPSMATFDAPNREVCISRRGRTNTPLQALVTLNDPVFVEAAQALARRVLRDGGATLQDRVRYAWHSALTREPNEKEIERIRELLEMVTAEYRKDPAAAKQMATEPIGPAPEGIDLAELAAWTVAGNVVLNLDELFLKR